MQLTEAIEEFIGDLKLAGRSERTIEGHELELRRLGRWLDNQVQEWETVTRRQLQQYARLRANLGFSSRSNMLCTLRTFYRWAVEMGYIALSPAAGFKTPNRPRPLPRSLTIIQVRRLLAHLRAGAGRRVRRDEVLVIVALYTGLRASELAALRWPAVDLDGLVINIRLAKMWKGRAVPLHPAVVPLLLCWRELQGLGEDAPVFSLDGEPIGPNRVGKIARRYARVLGLPLTAHVLRHTFATWALRGTRDLYGVSKALGHADVKQTEIYLSADVEDLRKLVDSLPGIEAW